MTSHEEVLSRFENALPDREEQPYILRLYVSGPSPKSRAAITNIRTVCEQYLPARYKLEVIDIYQQPRRALEAQVVAVPTLIKMSPLPVRRLVGDLSNTSQLLRRLGLKEDDLANTR
jgi:circadian clock protein KaiB